MNRLGILCVALSFAAEGCASERLYVQVTDNEGIPVSDVMVSVGFTSGHVVFAKGTFCEYESTTDINGNAVVKFDGDNSVVHWLASKDGYYTSGLNKVVYKIDVISIPPIYYKVVMLEHEKSVKTTLWKIRNPQPMYAHYPIEKCKVPKENGRYGFDLKLFDWVAPYGEGKEADFYVVRDYTQPTEEGRFRVGTLEFDRGCGFYLAENNGNENFQTAYDADTNTVFTSSVPLLYEHRKNKHHEYDFPLPLVDKNHHIVLRTRVKYDEDGNMVSAHYSRILGEFSAMPSVSVSESIFNPVPNDTNLEFDRGRNLYKPPRRRRRK